MTTAHGQRAVVTGASSGIGEATARELVAAGWRVLAVARRGDRLAGLAEELGDRLVPLALDLTAPGAGDTIAAEAKARLGGLDLLVNNAGMSYLGTFDRMPEDRIDAVIDLNVRALMKVTRAAIGLLEASGKGQIINVASIVARHPMQTIAVYCATKAAVVSFSFALAKELAARRIRVNVLSPTGTDTELFAKVGSDIDTSKLVPAADQAKMLVAMTKLPQGLDVLEIATDQRFNPLVL